MEIGTKIQELRKKNNLSQEELADKIGVARQTISKWELGETSPDLKQAKELSKVFNVSLDELVDNELKSVLVEKVSNTEKLAGLILKIIKVFGMFLLTILVLCILFIVFVPIFRTRETKNFAKRTVACEIQDKKMIYEFEFDKNTNRINYAGGSEELKDAVNLLNYSDVYSALNAIEEYAKNNYGSCEIINN